MILLNAFAVVALCWQASVFTALFGPRRPAHPRTCIRLALGAQRKDVLLLVLSQGMKMTLGGVTLGLLTALGLTGCWGLLYSVSATDLVTFTVITSILTAVVACGLLRTGVARDDGRTRWSRCAVSEAAF